MSETINALLMTHGALAAEAFIVAGLLTYLHQRYRHDYLRLWVLAWWASGISVAAATASLAMVMGPLVQSPWRTVSTVVFLAAQLLQVAFLVWGARVLGGRPPHRRRQVVLLMVGAAVVASVAVLAFRGDDLSEARYLARFVIPQFVAGLLVVLAAWLVLRDARLRANPGFLLVGVTLLIEGGRSLYISGDNLVHVLSAAPGAGDSFLLSLASELTQLFIQLLIGIGMAVGMLQHEHDRLLTADSHRDRAERALSDNERRLAALFEHTRDGVLFVDSQRRIVDFNPAALPLIGADPESLRGVDAIERVDPEARDRVEIAWRRLLESGSHGGEVRFPIGGVERVVDVHAVTDVAEGLNLVAFRDITEQRGIEQQLRHSQKLESMGRLAGGIAHDFNNILTAIVGYTGLLEQGLHEDDELLGHAREVLYAAERATSLTRQLLLLSSSEVEERVSLDLADVIESMETLLKRLIGEHIELLVRIEPGLRTVTIDRTHLEQVVLNLTVNAGDAMADGGTLTIEVSNSSPESLPADFVPSARDGDFVRLSFKDDGQGMSQEVMDHLFEPFFTTKASGTGLGLATVYSIVQQNDGWIGVDSRPGAGAHFEILLPASDEVAAEVAAEAQKTRIASQRGGRILVVEDEAPILELTRKILTHAGYDVVATTEPKQALTLVEENAGEICLLITDMVMPGMTGRQLAQTLVAQIPELPVLYVSGYTDEALENLTGSGLRGTFLRKPFTVASLTAKVAEVLGQ